MKTFLKQSQGATMNTNRHADHVDVHIGSRIRARRLQLGLSQIVLGEALGVSFQQIQKYEKGTNRVATATLIKIANVMEIEPGHFYHGAPGLSGKRNNGAPSEVDQFMSTKDGLMIARSFVAIADEGVRHAVAASIERISRALSPSHVQAAE